MSESRPHRDDRLLAAVRDRSPVSGLTHQFYKYPARFSPTFARGLIERFTEPGDLVMDPFVGGGTTAVEGLATGRRVIANDSSSLAHFLTRVKTSSLPRRHLHETVGWLTDLAERPIRLTQDGLAADRKYQRNLDGSDVWPIRMLCELGLQRVERLSTPAQRRFARVVLLNTAQWALDTRREFPTIARFRQQLVARAESMSDSLQEFRLASSRAKREAGLSGRMRWVRHGDAADLSGALREVPTPRLILTSPPYPGMHVLYHRWQLRGGKESPAPFWLAGTSDGQGAAAYTLADRYDVGGYFERLEAIYRSLRTMTSPDTVVAQLVAFNDPRPQLPRYLQAMRDAGFYELAGGSEGGLRIWRDVPSRRWYTSQRRMNGNREVLLLHRPR